MAWTQDGTIIHSFSYSDSSNRTISASNLTGHCWAAYFSYNSDPVLFLVFDYGDDVFTDSNASGQRRARTNCVSLGSGLWGYWAGMRGVQTDSNTFINDSAFDQYSALSYAEYMIAASGLVTYTAYWEYNGAQNTMEWRNATPGGVIFAFHRAQNDTYEFVLAYDLRTISNPEVGYMYMRRNDGGSSYVISTVYRYTDADVYTVSTNLTFYGSNNPSGWDVLLEGAHAGYEYPSVIRAYWDAQGGVENLYVGVNGKAQQVKALYVGVNGTAREVKAIYVGVNGKAREVFKST